MLVTGHLLYDAEQTGGDFQERVEVAGGTRERVRERTARSEMSDARLTGSVTIIDNADRFKAGPDAFSVSLDDGVYRVQGRRIERLAAQTNFDNAESAERFQRDLARLGVERELVKAGVVAGDSVRIGGVELEWDDESGSGRA